jgi:predicted DNA binding CopG/RHH family protein
MTPGQIAKFLEDFRVMGVSARPSKSRLISLKVPEPLLEAFKSKAGKAGTLYQTQIKRLMSDWVLTEGVGK